MDIGRAVRRGAPTTGGRLVYAVGDVHGRLDALTVLLRRIRDDARATPSAERPLLVLLGDYVDRGPQSREVIDLILALQADDAFDVIALKGNHEDALLQFLADPAFASTWAPYWGKATLASYGVEPPRDEAGCQAARAGLAAALPERHRAFLEGLPLTATVGDYLFVHAGIRPGVALAEQAERDLIWIRYEFLECGEDFGRVVVHGHTPSLRPELRANRIGVDTGAFATGVLTAVRLEGTDQRFIQGRG